MKESLTPVAPLACPGPAWRATRSELIGILKAE